MAKKIKITKKEKKMREKIREALKLKATYKGKKKLGIKSKPMKNKKVKTIKLKRSY